MLVSRLQRQHCPLRSLCTSPQHLLSPDRVRRYPIVLPPIRCKIVPLPGAPHSARLVCACNLASGTTALQLARASANNESRDAALPSPRPIRKRPPSIGYSRTPPELA